MPTAPVPPQEWGNNMERDLMERPRSTTLRSYWIAPHRQNAQHHHERTHNTPNHRDRIQLPHVQRSTTQRDPGQRCMLGRGKTVAEDQEKRTCFYYTLTFVEEEYTEEGAADIANWAIRQGIEDHTHGMHFESFVWEVIESPDYAN